MQVEFLEEYYNDIDSISQKSVKSKLIKLIKLAESAENINSFSNLKKLTGHKAAYRIRIGDYRVGFFYENNKIVFARVIHRKDIYRLTFNFWGLSKKFVQPE